MHRFLIVISQATDFPHQHLHFSPNKPYLNGTFGGGFVLKER